MFQLSKWYLRLTIIPRRASIASIRTPLLSSISVFATMNLYQISHRALLSANEVNRFICNVIRAHLRDLRARERDLIILSPEPPSTSPNFVLLNGNREISKSTEQLCEYGDTGPNEATDSALLTLLTQYLDIGVL